MEKIEKLLLTPEEVGAAISMSTRIVYQMIKSGDLRAIKMGPRVVRVHAESLREWIRKMEVKTGAGSNGEEGEEG